MAKASQYMINGRVERFFDSELNTQLDELGIKPVSIIFVKEDEEDIILGDKKEKKVDLKIFQVLHGNKEDADAGRIVVGSDAKDLNLLTKFTEVLEKWQKK